MSNSRSARGHHRGLAGRTRRAAAKGQEKTRAVGPDEKLIRRMLDKVGARPVGHAEPPADVGPPPPAAPPTRQPRPVAPAPDWPPTSTRRQISATGAGRLPPPGRTIVLTGDRDEAGSTAPAPETEDKTAATAGPRAADPDSLVEDYRSEERSQRGSAPAATTGPTESARVRKSPAQRALNAADDPNLRILAFNGTAAAVGYLTPLVEVFGRFLPYADQAARGVFALLLAAAGAGIGWRATGYPAVKKVFGDTTPFVRLSGTAGLAELGRRLAPLPVNWLNSKGADHGLGANAVSLVLTALGICGGLWWFIDRRTRRWHWTARWLLRVPLASALLACALYTT
ncbi:hypothetical protein [Streptomyces sp. NPDC059743]|uniref:hypothetical protein n=1 Tax=Streptomyces sp. NPDC059743 TaxID=3346928 RepID=UPI00365F0398